MSYDWLDPECDEPGAINAVPLDEASIEQYSRYMVAEPLVAQRLLSTRSRGLILGRAQSGEADLALWGHSFASAVATLMPSSITESSSSDRRKRRKHQEQLLQGQVDWPDLATTSNVAYLLCADDYPPEVGLPRQLYPKETEDSFLSFEGFYPLLQSLIKAVSPSHGSAWLDGRTGLKEALTTILAETFRNTHDHARQEINKSDVRDSIRGIYARFYDLNEVAALAIEQNPLEHSPALRYANSFIPKSAKPGVRSPIGIEATGILELSVFDSGPGMAAKWLERDIEGVSPEDQLQALLSCFTKGKTSTGTNGRGYGLAKVLLKLRELHGFISVRSNQIHAYRQFNTLRNMASTELADGMLMPAEKLLDWKQGLTTVPTARHSVKGTVVSFLLPMGQP